jgi:hypothetical protein
VLLTLKTPPKSLKKKKREKEPRERERLPREESLSLKLPQKPPPKTP